MVLRRMDDVVHVYRLNRISADATHFLQTLRQNRFYGAQLSLERSLDPVAFGFRFRVSFAVIWGRSAEEIG